MLNRLFIFSLLILHLSAHAITIPGLPSTADHVVSPAIAASPVSDNDKTAQIQQRLELAQTQLKQLSETATPGSAGYNRRFLLQVQITAYRQHLAALAGIKAQEGLAKNRPPVEAIASGVIALNTQRQIIQANQLDLANLSAVFKTQELQLSELRDNLEAGQAELRLKNETLERAKPADQAAALEQLKLAQLQLDARTAVLQSMEERQNYTRVQIQNSRERQEALTLAMKDMPKTPKINTEELQTVQQRIENQRQQVSQQIASLSEAKQQWLDQIQALSDQRKIILLEKEAAEAPAEHNKKKATRRSPAELEQALEQISAQERINYLRLDNNSLRIGILLDLMNSYTLESAFWQMQYNLGTNKETTDLDAFHRLTLKWDSHLTSIAAEIQQSITVAQMEASLIEGADALAKTERQLWLDRADAFRAAESEVSRLRLLINRWGEQFSVKDTEQTLAMRWEIWQDKIVQKLHSVWEFEIFSVADTMQVDGQTINISRSVTVGKVVYAILLITIGFFITLKLGNLIERLLINYAKYPEIIVRIGKRWLLAVAFIILLINSLLLVRIPLTAFAFMGGAIAIGLGFGMQTLLKNLISGLMMILERPFKPGDTVEVGTLRGTVVDMSVRAAVIRDVNGIETLVPNSTFLEQNVTNWTYSSSQVRQNVKVGMAYGSDVRLVAKLLADDVERHGQICKEPRFEILLEDFGADALMFGVYYWIDVNAGTIGRQVASDLRFMIEASLRKHDIAIAFPQRDVHVDIAQPIKVQVSEDAKPENAVGKT
ncbi:mechanosensitive ion channel [Chitinibacter bivalviorum]|uniref:Mechanosensitive ion channel n=1 Tax=Chitinibacter bivalviorum TaxID=2739434 RepID=A0A7H9BE87_9NEIS|nr:mechanosensitive ion channel domain-containing protein [Chitinibacter bivalviorum]QLG86847.1 mechanosensitive ion channel [Chitinibacter bivalviorum]